MEKILMEDLKEAMRDRNKIKKDALQLVISKAKSFAKDEKRDVLAADYSQAIKSELKQTRDAYSQMKEYLSAEKRGEYEIKISILEGYLPEQLSMSQIDSEINLFFMSESLEKSPKNMGVAMKSLKLKLGDRVDAALLSKRVKEYLK